MIRGGLAFIENSNSDEDVDYTVLTVDMVPKYFQLNMHIKHGDLPKERKSLFSIGNTLQIFTKGHRVYLKADLNDGGNAVEILIFRPNVYRLYSYEVGSHITWYESIKTIGVVHGSYDDNSDAGAHVDEVSSAEYKFKVTLSKHNQMTVDTVYINSLAPVDNDHNVKSVTSGVAEECDAKVKLYAESADFLQLKSFSLLSLDGSAESTDSCKKS